MSSNNQISQWIQQLKAGDSDAAQHLWQRYFPRIVRLAQRKLEGAKRGMSDEEDLALSVFKSVCIGAQEGRFPRLSDRDSLWSLLMAITAHKSVDHIRHENRKKRGGAGVVASDSTLDRKAVPLAEDIEDLASPEFAAELAEQFSLLLNKLERANDPDLLGIAIAKMNGASTSEVAEELGCVRRTVERKVQLIRRIWEKEIEGT